MEEAPEEEQVGFDAVILAQTFLERFEESTIKLAKIHGDLESLRALVAGGETHVAIYANLTSMLEAYFKEE